MGSFEATREGYYEMANVPILRPQYDSQNVVVTTEPINPLYVGQYAVGPYEAGAVAPSGTTPVGQGWFLNPNAHAEIDLPATISISNSAPPAAGTPSSPISTDPQGWWTACLCDYGRTAWSTLTVQANRTLTIEVTAQDEQGYTTAAKMMPVIGVWNVTDATGSLPTIAAAGTAFNATAIGMTTVTAQSTQPQQLRIAIADQRGDGRPDYAYQGRVLYADTIAPATVPATGGTVTINGMGFRSGNTVTVNGVAATVTSWSPTTIVATVPTLSALQLHHSALRRCSGQGPHDRRHDPDDRRTRLCRARALAQSRHCTFRYSRRRTGRCRSVQRAGAARRWSNPNRGTANHVRRHIGHSPVQRLRSSHLYSAHRRLGLRHHHHHPARRRKHRRYRDQLDRHADRLIQRGHAGQKHRRDAAHPVHRRRSQCSFEPPGHSH